MEEERLIISRLPEDVLKPHPDNPRKDLGDLTELTESIKANGIMQNLTVIPTKDLPGGDPNSERYTILIGHRRFAAGKAAGLTVFPCRIVRGLSHAEQVAIMLEENIQRNDLTLREQAEGMQMLLDLGESYQTITKKTGFSESTIRHRVNLLKLDSDLFEERQHQITLTDFAKLESIPEERRDEALRSGESSSAIQAAVDRIKSEEKRKSIVAAARKTLNEMGLIEDKDMRTWGADVHWFDLEKKKWLDEVRELIGDEENVPYQLSKYSANVYIQVKKDDEEEEEELSEEQKLKNKIQTANRKRKEIADEIMDADKKRLHDKLIDFLTEDEAGVWDAEIIAEVAGLYMSMEYMMDSYSNYEIDKDDVIEAVLKADAEEWETDIELNEIDKYYDKMRVGAKMILRAAEQMERPYDWNMAPRREPKMHIISRILKYVPFTFSPDAVELIEGTSMLYQEITEQTVDTWERSFKEEK